MNTEPPVDSNISRRVQADAAAASTWRLLAVVAVWLVLRLTIASDSDALKLALDLGVAIAAYWAVRPGAQAGDPAFMRSGRPTSILAVVTPLGVILALGDAWRLLHS